MKIFISDLHLGDGSKTDDFHRDAEFLDFIDHIINLPDFEKLIILGDLYELWQSHLDKIMWKHFNVITELQYLKNIHKLTFVYGNHDYLPFSKYRPGTYQTDDIFAQHGHQYDMFNRYKNPLFALKWPIGKYATVLLAEIERWFHKDADVWIKKMIDRYGSFLMAAAAIQNKWPRQLADVERNIRSLLYIGDHSDFKIIVMGHTHHADLDFLPNHRIYANTGAWVDNVEPTYVCVTEETVELRNGLNHEAIRKLNIV